MGNEEQVQELGSHRVLGKFSALFRAMIVREVLQAAFLIWLARRDMIGYGQFMLALGSGQILLMFAEFGLNQHLVCWSSKRPDEMAGELQNVAFLKSMLLGCGGLITWVFILSQDYGHSLSVIVLLLALGVGLESLASAFFTVCQVQERQRVEGRVRIVAAVAGFGFALTALGLGLPLAFVALYKLIETVINVVGGAVAVRRRLHVHIRWPGWSGVVATARGGVVFALIGLVAITYNKANLFFLQSAGGATAVAQYSAAWQIIEGVTGVFCGLLLGKTLFPLFARLVADNFTEASRLARESARWLILAAMVLVIGLAVESDRIIPLVYGPGYTDAAWIQYWLAIAIGIGFLHNLAAYLMMSLGREKLLLVFYVLGLIVNLVLCAVLIPVRPLAGAVIAILVVKLFVGSLTVGFCQLRFGLLQAQVIGQVLLAAAVGTILSWALGPLGSRLLSECALILPFGVLGILWRRAQRRSTS